jgi:hypothetical protein
VLVIAVHRRQSAACGLADSVIPKSFRFMKDFRRISGKSFTIMDLT